MGNTESNVTSGVKKQADTSSIQMYKLVDLKGGGLLVELMKRAAQNKQYAELDHAIKTKVEPFLYNKGQGRLISIAKLVLLRNKDRPRTKMLPPLRNMENPDDFDVIGSDIPGIPDPKPDDDPSTYRDVCWDLNERGAVGETILHLCLLNATSLHADLAKRLLRFYPKLINDIYMCDEYYGESVLHIAIVNEDPSMVKFLLDSGADYHERCFGNFMCPEDQKGSRTDSFDHEWVNLFPITNYEGYVYWGEYPLTFAACLGQEECYRLMLSRGANPDNQDTNGNTILHMLVIYEKLATFDTAYELGANVSIRNVQNLTPLTLAAKLARIEMFFHILNIEREIYWQIGSITCAAYPLGLIDTIDIETGNISKDSALNLVVFGDKDEHLELMDGVLVDLLHAKWNSFVKFRFYRQFSMFFIYFLISLICFTLRPGPIEKNGLELQNTTLLGGTMITNPMQSTNEITITSTTTIPNVISVTNNKASIKSEKYVDLFYDNKTSNQSDLLYVDDNFNFDKQINDSESINFNISKREIVEESINLKPTDRETHNDMNDKQRVLKIEVDFNNMKKNKSEKIMVYSEISSSSTNQQIENIQDNHNIMYEVLFNRMIRNNSVNSYVGKPAINETIKNENKISNKSHDNISNVNSNNNNNNAEQLSLNNDFEIIKSKTNDYHVSGLVRTAKLSSKDKNEDVNGIFHYNHNRNPHRNITTTSTTISVVKNIILSPLPTVEGLSNSFIREGWWDDFAGDCPLLQIHDSKDAIRLIAEVALEVGSFLYLLAALREARFLGLNMMIENLMTAPSRVMFLFSCCLMMGMPFLRFSCYDETEDIVAVVIMLTTAPYFLFFCRGFKTVGPFVVMIYRMVMGDLLRFVSIYLVFVMGFSQAYYIIFLSYDNPTTPDGIDDSASNPLPNPVEAVMAMFFMSLTNFGDYYGAFEKTDHEVEAKIFFVIYMAIVAILLVNMLIAMMGNTYQKIAETRNEWQRQWARIVLVVERGVSPSERLKKLMSYSQPMSDGRRALVLRLNQTEEDKEEMKEVLEMKRVHDKLVLKRKQGKKLLGADTPSPKHHIDLSSPKPAALGAL